MEITFKSNIREAHQFSRMLYRIKDNHYTETQRDVRNKDLEGKMM